MAKKPSDINEKFFNIINQENWELPEFEDDPIIDRTFLSQFNMPLGNMFLPTPIPGVWISIDIGFEMENPDEDDRDARW